jgi:hypothetical protein
LGWRFDALIFGLRKGFCHARAALILAPKRAKFVQEMAPIRGENGP